MGGAAGAGGGRRSGAEGSALDKQQQQAVTAEAKMRQLEAENLRLRFRVADLEGQVWYGIYPQCTGNLPASEEWSSFDSMCRFNSFIHR